MRTRRRARRPRTLWVRIAGYGGAALLAAAAVAVLLLPLLDGSKGGARTSRAGPSAPATGGSPGGSAQVDPTEAAPRRNGGSPYPGGQNGGSGGGDGGGPEIPEQNGSSALGWCPRGTAYYRAARDGVDVAISVAGSGAVRAELALQGYAPQSQQTTVKGGGPHTFHFRGVAPGLVRRVTVTTVSVGVAMQTCYARAAA
ncbi:hypothetical protein ACFOY4_26355 [Actinomadura syzygii]|uniref:Uncharacterized protein n=1 Tax=Actinomadura syzygii TaxID=1427538 RepID=A0A5D0TPW3_9ACTN|nr:hypothetical protein [Actinomadura syzygii]TYC07713.1 hypothetical protein FXF65_41470 [Actinomadura syzygii]